MTRTSRSFFSAIALTALLGVAGGPATEAEAASLLVDAETGAVIFADAPNHLWYPASLTKMMTIYLALNEIKAGRLSFEEKIIVSRKAASVSPVRFGLAAGQVITVRQAINAAIVASANDAAVALAEKIGGTEQDFANIMTLVAQSVGMTRTNFRNATGLPDAHQVTTAHDMALLAMTLLRDHPSYYSLFNQRSVTIDRTSLGTVNSILGSYKGADGIKTGFTCGSGYNLVASATRGKRRVIGVLLGSGSREQRLSEMTKLLDLGLARDVSPKVRLATLLISGKDEGSPPIILSGPTCAALREDEEETATAASGGSWAITFGSYADKAKSQMALAQARSQLGVTSGAGTATITSKTEQGIAKYSPMIVGLTQSAAANACKTLRAKNLHCLAIGPEILGTSNLAWR